MIDSPGKLYYSISEVADMFNVNQSLIRYWEKQFKEIAPKKDKKGVRKFTSEDIEKIALIYYLVKERKLTLEGTRKKLKENKEDVIENYEIVKRLKEVKQQLLDIKKFL